MPPWRAATISVADRVKLSRGGLWPRKPRLLVIDDQPTILEALRRVFVRAFPAVEVLTAPDGETGVRLVAGVPATVAVVDYHLPGADGVEVAALLSERHAAESVILMTASDDPRVHAKALATSRVRAFLRKPLDLEDLVKLVGRELRSRFVL